MRPLKIPLPDLPHILIVALALLVLSAEAVRSEEDDSDAAPREAVQPVPKIPEPLIFDLMRPLHAKAGELEVNALAVFGRRGGVSWAPEAEYALDDGLAIEFEFPFHGADFEAAKLGLQFRLGHSEKSVYGIQLLGEKSVDGRETQLNALYLFGHRFNDKWSLMSMSGVRYGYPVAHHSGWEGLQNLTLFHKTTSSLVSGLEVNWAFSDDTLLRELVVIPQAQIEFSEHCSLQFGVGTRKSFDSPWQTIYAVRTIFSW